MSAPFFDKVDVFLPGHGQTLARAPAYRWRRSDRAVAHLYYSTTEPRSVLLHVAGLSRDEVRALAALPLQFDDSGSRHHDFDGFGLHLPGLLVTAGGTAIATCQKRHNSMADSGNQIDPMVSRSQDDGNNWEPQRVIFAEEGCSAILGPIFQNCASGTVSISFWKLPADVTDDLGYFAHHASGGGEFWLLQSDDEGHTWPLSRVVDPNRCRYSDLAVSPDGTILCLYTNGETGDRDRISIARFNMEWLLETATAKHR